MVVSDSIVGSIAPYQEYKGISWPSHLGSFQYSHTPLAFHHESAAGAMVSIAAFQAVDPGSIPGPRNSFCFLYLLLH